MGLGALPALLEPTAPQRAFPLLALESLIGSVLGALDDTPVPIWSCPGPEASYRGTQRAMLNSKLEWRVLVTPRTQYGFTDIHEFDADKMGAIFNAELCINLPGPERKVDLEFRCFPGKWTKRGFRRKPRNRKEKHEDHRREAGPGAAAGRAQQGRES